MNVFFEDDGQLKAGTVLADNDASLQVESRVRQAPQDQGRHRAAALRRARRRRRCIAEAQTLAAELDADFLWEVSADDEFGFADLAREYFGHAPTAAEAAAVALALPARRCTSTSAARAATARRPPTR